jgi:hypothetical protein
VVIHDGTFPALVGRGAEWTSADRLNVVHNGSNLGGMGVGIPLGVLVGFLSGAAFVVFIRAAFREEGLKAGTSLLAMPTSWFGGGWLTQVFDVEQILSSYVTALSVTVVVIGAIPLFKVVVRVTREIAAE